jgi:hypothetical protein
VTTEVNSPGDPSIVGNPVLRQVSITNWPAASTGIYFRVKVRVFNREGFADSPYLRILNSGHPEDLPSPVQLNEQSDTMFLVTLPQVTDAKNGGSPIISYSLEIDDGEGGDFIVLSGLDSVLMQTEFTVSAVRRGLVHRLRYRVLNSIGWSNYSPNLFALAATFPSQPLSPYLK